MIQRYDVFTSIHDRVEHDPNPDGEYVLFKDHDAEVACMNARIMDLSLDVVELELARIVVREARVLVGRKVKRGDQPTKETIMRDRVRDAIALLDRHMHPRKA